MSARESGLSRPIAAVAAGGVAVALALVALGLGAARCTAEREARLAAFPREAGRLRVDGIRASVEVLRDARGVPHIEAQSEADAWFAMGFVHAQDRLGQMLWQRRVARGRSAEWIGEQGLAADRLARALGIGRTADAQVERLDPGLRALLDAYARGVNARIARVRRGDGTLPVEAPTDAAPPEPWRPGDSLALLKLVHWCNGPMPETSLLLEALIDRLGGMGARPFFPTGVGVQGMGLPFDLPTERAGRPVTRRLARSPSTVPAAPRLGVGFAATGFALSGRLTASGAPILLVDVHLPPTAPALFYELQVRGGSLDAAGATIPGIPVLLAGRNPDLAWAATPAQVLTVSLYREVVREGDPGEYRDRERWLPLTVREEEIRVRRPDGALRAEQLRVRATRRGPLVNELIDSSEITGDRQALSLAWTGARPGDGLASLARLARARSGPELVESLRDHHEPVLAVLYADRTGRIGTQLAGWIPSLALPTGMVPVPSRLSVYHWRRPVRFEGLPAQHVEPDDQRPVDWVIAADNPLADGFGSGFGTSRIEWMWRTGERGARVDDMLGSLVGGPAVDLRGVVEAQSALVGAVSPGLVEALLELAGSPAELSPEAREVATLLRGWDGEMSPGSPGAAAYHVLLWHLVPELFAEPMGTALLERYLGLPWTRVQSVVEQLVIDAADAPAAGGWSDPTRVRAAVRASLRSAWRTLRDRMGPNRDAWRWGRLHEARFEPLVPTVSGTPLLPRGAVGRTFTVAGFADYDPARPFSARRVPSYRMAVDLGAPDRMLTALAPGQSEHPGHPHFDDGLSPWLEGRSELFATSRFLVEEQGPHRLVLEPGP